MTVPLLVVILIYVKLLEHQTEGFRTRILGPVLGDHAKTVGRVREKNALPWLNNDFAMILRLVARRLRFYYAEVLGANRFLDFRLCIPGPVTSGAEPLTSAESTASLCSALLHHPTPGCALGLKLVSTLSHWSSHMLILVSSYTYLSRD